MKKMMSVLLVLAIVCAASSSALSESKVAVLRNGEVVKVIYKSVEPADVKVTISDANGEKVFSEELISTHGFIRPYNFSELPKGDYTICVTDVEGKKTEKICFRDDHSWTAHLTKLSDPEKVLVAVPQGAANNFTVEVFDKDNQLLYTEDQKLETEYARVFNLKKLDHGATVQLTNRVTGEIKSLRAE